MNGVAALKQHFDQISPREQLSSWEPLWQKKVTPWDQGQPNPALVDALKERPEILGHATPASRKRVLVPGCGKGYDVVLFASYGSDAFGLDTATSAIQAAEAYKEKESEAYTVKDEKLGRGHASFLLADFFDDGFLSRTGGRTFDAIYDYTFLCALHPDLRPSWAKRMSELLAKDGTLVCMEFPLGKPASSGGPPHGLTSDLYVELFKRPGEDVAYDEAGVVVVNTERVASSGGLTRVAHWKPDRVSANGADKTMVSIWRHA